MPQIRADVIVLHVDKCPLGQDINKSSCFNHTSGFCCDLSSDAKGHRAVVNTNGKWHSLQSVGSLQRIHHFIR